MNMRPVRSPTLLTSSCHVQQAAKRDDMSGAVLKNDVYLSCLLLADLFELENCN